jgi:hypothetical protein
MSHRPATYQKHLKRPAVMKYDRGNGTNQVWHFNETYHLTDHYTESADGTRLPQQQDLGAGEPANEPELRDVRAENRSFLFFPDGFWSSLAAYGENRYWV